MGDWLKEWAREKGYQAGWADLALLDAIQTFIDDLAQAGQIDRDVYDGLLQPSFHYRPKDGSGGLINVIVVSVPRTHHYIVFETGDGPFKAKVPCTYVSFTGIYERVQKELADHLAARFPDRTYHLERLPAPLKSLATRTGIATYGRNNISYAPGAGSSHQLVGFFTDAEPGEAAISVDPRASFGSGDTGCTGCEACIKACPTGALVRDQFVVHASRCVTYLNEYPGAWPDWVPESVHNCLVGCLRCQEACPRNRAYFKIEPAHESFTAEETRAILESAGAELASEWVRPATPVWDSIHSKMTSLGLAYYEPLLARNLGALMKAEGRL